MHRLVYTLLIVLLAMTSVGAQSQTPVGIWLHANKRIRVKIFPCSERLCGKIVWFRRPNDARGLPLVDLKNPNPKLRKRPLLGLMVLRGLRRTSQNLWTDGKIYNPDDGVDYQAKMSIHNGTLSVRACADRRPATTEAPPSILRLPNARSRTI